jgi:hypothetical protein
MNLYVYGNTWNEVDLRTDFSCALSLNTRIEIVHTQRIRGGKNYFEK